WEDWRQCDRSRGSAASPRLCQISLLDTLDSGYILREPALGLRGSDHLQWTPLKTLRGLFVFTLRVVPQCKMPRGTFRRSSIILLTRVSPDFPTSAAHPPTGINRLGGDNTGHSAETQLPPSTVQHL